MAAADPMEHVLPSTLFRIGPFAFTNHSLMVLISAVVMLIVFPLAARNYPVIPTGFRNMIEAVMQFIRQEVATPSLGAYTDRFMPFIWTLFFFILINDLLGMIPLDSFARVIVGKQHIFGAGTASLAVTAGLAFVAFVMIHVSGTVEQYRHLRHRGMKNAAAVAVAPLAYLRSIVPAVPGMLGIVLFLPLLVLELIGAVVKPFALAIRLFANIMAGHVVLSSLLMLAPAARSWPDAGIASTAIIGCAGLSILEVFVAFLQAYIFTFLTCLFIGAAVNPEH